MRRDAAVTLDLRADVAKRPALAVDTSKVTAKDRDAAIANWRERMVSEHASARVFGVLTGQMIAAGLPRAEIRRVADMASQELDHGLLCARVLAALGAEPVGALPRLDDVPAHEDVAPLEAVLRNAISIGCCSETVAVALVATERERARLRPRGDVDDVLDAILRDEVKHARFGWRLVGRFSGTLDGAARERMDAYLDDVLAHQIAFHAPFLGMGAAAPEGVAIGAPDGPSSFRVFVETMETVVVPGLDGLGFRASAAWRRAARDAEAA